MKQNKIHYYNQKAQQEQNITLQSSISLMMRYMRML